MVPGDTEPSVPVPGIDDKPPGGVINPKRDPHDEGKRTSGNPEDRSDEAEHDRCSESKGEEDSHSAHNDEDDRKYRHGWPPS